MRKPFRLVVGLLALASVAACNSGTNPSDSDATWSPDRDVVLNVPWPPGGGTDNMARAMAKGLEKARPDVKIGVENRPGATGATGYAWVKQREGDPNVLSTVEGSLLVLPEFSEAPISYKDFTMIGGIADYHGTIFTRSGRFQDLGELVKYAKTHRVKIGTTGPQDLWSLAGKAVEQESGAKFHPVAFEGMAKAIPALVGGDVDLVIGAPEVGIEFMKSGDLDALAVLTDKRVQSKEFSSVPTAREQGVDVSFTMSKGIAAPADITQAQQKYWTKALLDWTKTPSYEKYIKENLLIERGQGAKAFTKSMKEDQRLVSRLAASEKEGK